MKTLTRAIDRLMDGLAKHIPNKRLSHGRRMAMATLYAECRSFRRTLR